MDIDYHSPIPRDAGTLNSEGWLESIKIAARGTSPDSYRVNRTTTCPDIQLSRHEVSDSRRLRDRLRFMKAARAKHATAAYELTQRLENRKRRYGELLYQSTELQIALKAQEELLKGDEMSLATEISCEQHVLRQIRGIEEALEVCERKA